MSRPTGTLVRQFGTQVDSARVVGASSESPRQSSDRAAVRSVGPRAVVPDAGDSVLLCGFPAAESDEWREPLVPLGLTPLFWDDPGSHALECWAPSVAAIDVDEQGETAPSLIKRLLTIKPPFPIVVLASTASCSLAAQSLAAGAHHLVTKPIAPETLGAVLLAVKRSVKHGQDLDEAEQRLGKLAHVESLSRLAADVAHELRTPLGVICQGVHMLGSLLEGQKRAKTLRKVLANVSGAADRADAVVHGLLTAALPAEIGARSSDLNELVESFVGEHREELAACNIDVETDLSSELPLLLFDAAQLEVVLGHLVSNARHAMPEGGSLRLATRWIDLGDAGDKAAQLVVEDSGAGIDARVLPLVFEPFFGTRGLGEGLGMGLTVARVIAELHGGELTLHNRSCHGVRAVVTLPGKGR